MDKNNFPSSQLFLRVSDLSKIIVSAVVCELTKVLIFNYKRQAFVDSIETNKNFGFFICLIFFANVHKTGPLEFHLILG